jgi:uncharacterized protein (TIGR03435 family)
MTSAIVNHLWQSTVFVLAAAIVAHTFRRHRARVRHAVWLAASLKFLLPFSVLIALGGTIAWRTSPARAGVPAPAFVETVQTITEPFSDNATTPPSAADAVRTPSASQWPLVLAALWVGGVVVVLAMRVRGWLTVRAALRASAPATLPDVDRDVRVRATSRLLEPGVVGVWRPILLVPVGLDTLLTVEQLRAVVAHELHHVRRRDNLTSIMHMAVEALFWFHPMVWWIGARLVDERERACDEHVVATGAAPDAYAEAILNVCKRYLGVPVPCVAGVTGSDLKKRLNAIVAGRVGRDLSISRRAVITAVAVTALVVPVAAGMITAPLRTTAQGQPTGPVPKFDVVSVRPCEANAPSQTRDGGSPIASPGRLYYQCFPLSSMVNEAYIYFAGGRYHRTGSELVGIEGGPGWMKSDRFTVEAKTDQNPPAAVMRGPMLQALLEDRFRLKMRRETRELPIYELVIAASGAKVSPYTGHDCVIQDDAAWPPVPPPSGQTYCRSQFRTDGDSYIRSGVISLDLLADLFRFDHPVVNRTGITAPVSLQLEYPRPGPGAEKDPPPATLVRALRDQLGLDLRPAKAALEFLVIEHVERPASSEADASASATQAPVVATDASVPADKQKFDVASLRPCEGSAGTRGGGAGNAGGPAFSPERLYLSCITPQMLIELAYVLRSDADAAPNASTGFGNWPTIGLANDDGAQRIRSGPSWMYNDRYTLEATAAAVTTVAQRNAMTGPMLRALLADRFKLRMHTGTEQAAMYAMTVAKSGLKIAPMKDGDCAARVADGPAGPPVSVIEATANHVPPTCQFNLEGPTGPNWRYQLSGLPLARLAGLLSSDLGVKVIDQTGVKDKFVFTWEYGPDDRTPGALRRLDAVNGGAHAPPTAPDIFTALRERLGVQLDAIKGDRAYLVVDHIERPDAGGIGGVR